VKSRYGSKAESISALILLIRMAVKPSHQLLLELAGRGTDCAAMICVGHFPQGQGWVVSRNPARMGGWPTLCPFAPPKVGCPTFRDFRKVGIRNDGITRLKFGLLEFVHEHGSAGDEVEVSGAVVALEFFGHRNLVTESSGLFV
jgi:hypothetical protein